MATLRLSLLLAIDLGNWWILWKEKAVVAAKSTVNHSETNAIVMEEFPSTITSSAALSSLDGRHLLYLSLQNYAVVERVGLQSTFLTVDRKPYESHREEIEIPATDVDEFLSLCCIDTVIVERTAKFAILLPRLLAIPWYRKGCTFLV